MRKTSFLALAVLAMLVLLPVRSAEAQNAPRSRGLDFTLGLGVAGCTDAYCAGFDPSAQVRLEILYRPLRYMAVGAHLGWQFVDPDRNQPSWVDWGWSMLLGPEIRGILPVGPLEAWMGLTLGFMRQQIDMENQSAADIDRAWSNGFGLGFGFGTQYFVHPKVALGLDFWLYKGFFDEACTYENDGDPREQLCGSLSRHEKAAIGVVFTFGAVVTFFLPL